MYVQDLFGPLFFGLTHGLTEFLDKNHKVETVIMRFERVAYMDQSGLELLHAALATFSSTKNQGIIYRFIRSTPKRAMDNLVRCSMGTSERYHLMI